MAVSGKVQDEHETSVYARKNGKDKSKCLEARWKRHPRVLPGTMRTPKQIMIVKDYNL